MHRVGGSGIGTDGATVIADPKRDVVALVGNTQLMAAVRTCLGKWRSRRHNFDRAAGRYGSQPDLIESLSSREYKERRSSAVLETRTEPVNRGPE